jgi:hypothetical protein
MIAIPNDAWQTVNWSNDIEIMEGIRFNIQDYLTERGIKL